MCYHLNGVLQNYDLLKTEDIPAASGFEPAVVHDIAQNICSFLRANCAKEGHTYWLYKEENADVVRLYDLTALCGETADGGSTTNPFAYPVAVLLFRIAARMYSEEKRDMATIENLLRNVLALVDAARFPELATATTFLLVGLHTKGFFASNHAEPGRRHSGAKRPPPRHKGAASDTSPPKPGSSNRAAEPEERLRRLSEGVSWVHKGAQPTKSHASLLRAVLDLACTNYLELAEKLMSNRAGPRVVACAHMALMCHAGAVAMAKGAAAAATAGGEASSPDPTAPRIGHDTRSILPFAPVTALKAFTRSARDGDTTLARVLEIVGDVYSRMPEFFDGIATAADDAAARHVGDVDLPFLQALAWLAETMPTDDLVAPIPSREHPQFSGNWKSQGLPESFCINDAEAVERAVHAYRQAASIPNLEETILTRLFKKEGNALNVFGIGVTHAIIEMVTVAEGDGLHDSTQAARLASMTVRAQEVLNQAVKAFQRASNKLNEAVVYCNLAKLTRAYAAGVAYLRPGPDGNPTRVGIAQQQCKLLEDAIDYYTDGQAALGNREDHPDVWDSVSLDIGSTHTACAQIAISHLAVASASAVIHLDRALRVYEAYRDAQDEVREDVVQRIAEVHRQLGCLYGRDAAQATSEEERSKFQCVADMHFKKALATYASREGVTSFVIGRIDVQVEWATGQVWHNPTNTLATIGSIAASIEALCDGAELRAGVVQLMNRLPTNIGKVVLVSMRNAPSAAAALQKEVYKGLLSEMQAPLSAEAAHDVVRAKASRLADLLRRLVPDPAP